MNLNQLKSRLPNISLEILRVALGIVFVWFGELKLFSHSAIMDLVKNAYPFLPYPTFTYILGGMETIIGFGLITKILVKPILFLMFLQMTGTFLVILIAPHLVFAPYFPILTLEGEFIVKNLVLISAGFVILEHLHHGK